MEIQREGVGPGHQHRRQSLHPTRQEPPLLVGRRTIRVIGGEALLGEDVQTGEESQRPSKLKSSMWLRRSLSRSFSVRRLSTAASAGTIRDPA